MPDNELTPSFGPTMGRFTEWLENHYEWAEIYGDWVIEFFEDFQETTERRWIDALQDLPPAYQQIAFQTCLEDFMTYDDEEEEGSPITAYIEEHRASLSETEVEYLQAVKGSSLSLYEVTDVVPKSHLILRDLLRQSEPIQVRERSASQYLVQWQTIAVRVIEVNGTPMLTGAAIPVPTEIRGEVLLDYDDMVKGALKEVPKLLRKDPRQVRLAQNAVLATFPSYLAAVWMHDMLSKARRRPTLVNDDKEEIVMVYLSYPLEDPGAVIEALDAAAGFQRPDPSEPQWLWFEEEPAEGRPIRAFIWLRGDHLDVETNSHGRRDRLDARLSEILAGNIGVALMTERSPFDESEDTVNDFESIGSIARTVEEEEQIREAIRQHLDDHYRRTLDDEVPALGNRTPRELVATPEGQTLVANWLKDLEVTTAQAMALAPISDYDFLWMWKELGIEELRR